MPWITEPQLENLVRFLEPEPPLNPRGNLQLAYLGFYQSELKGLGQTINYLRSVQDGTADLNANDRATIRYRNTLQDLALIANTDDKWQISVSGQQLLQIASDRGIDPGTLTDEASREVAVELETTIFQSLLNEVLAQPDPPTRSSKYMLKMLARLQHLVDAIPEDELDATSHDLELLLFLQAINASGYEVPRYFRLNPDDRADVLNIWKDSLASNEFPQAEPTDQKQRMLFLYQHPLKSNRIQNDIRYRVHGALRAYIDLRDKLGNLFPRLDAQLQITEFTLGGLRAEGKSYRLPPREIVQTSFSRQRIISGCPGSGKSTRLAREIAETEGNEAIVRRTVLHSETSYYDFVGCYKPAPVYEQTDTKILDGSGDLFQAGRPYVDYRYVPGVFTEALIIALKNATHNVYFIIEELNRGPCSAIFGDMLQLLDRKQNGTSEYEINPDADLSMFLRSHHIEVPLSLPSNLFIWATMNAADEGVFPVDSAFKRRWDFEYMGFDSPCAYGQAPVRYAGSELSWDTFRAAINQALITAGIHEDKLIGPYFLSEEALASPERIANKLFLYLWDDALRFRRDLLFQVSSFNELLNIWENGAGAPLTIQLPDPI